MPSHQAQMVRRVSEDQELEERAWIYYYKYCNCPANHLLISMLKSMLKDTKSE